MLHTAIKPQTPTYEPAFLEALLARVERRHAWNKANPVSTAGRGWIVTHRIEQRQREHARLTAIGINATILLEPEVNDPLAVEIAENDLNHWLSEDHGQLEREAWALVRRAVA